MTEDLFKIVSASPRWQLAAKDDVILTELHAMLWQWLLVADKPKDVIALGHILENLEDLFEAGVPPGSGEVVASLKPKGADGFSAHVVISPEQLIFSLMEFIWMGEQGHDHGAILDDEGRPFRLCFTPEGSFDRTAFDFWLRYADDATPTSMAGQSIVFASWHAKGN